MNKPLKPKKCKHCKNEFQPIRPLQSVCTPLCAFSYTRDQKERSEAKKQAENKKVLKEKLKTKSDYEKELQKEVNTIIRLIDQGHECISSLRPMKKEDVNAGHFWSRGGSPELRFNLFNIYAQSIEQNMYQSGNPMGFMEGLRHYFGYRHKDYVIDLKKNYSALKLTVDQLKNATIKAKAVIKWLKLQDRMFTTEERLILRDRFNQEIGIYL